MRSLLLGIAFAAVTSTFAQDQSSITQRAQLLTERMTAQLHLSSDQAARVLTINQRYLGVLDQLDHMKVTPSASERRARVQADHHKALLDVLNDDQDEDLHGLKAQWMDEAPADSTAIGQ